MRLEQAIVNHDVIADRGPDLFAQQVLVPIGVKRIGRPKAGDRRGHAGKDAGNAAPHPGEHRIGVGVPVAHRMEWQAAVDPFGDGRGLALGNHAVAIANDEMADVGVVSDEEAAGQQVPDIAIAAIVVDDLGTFRCHHRAERCIDAVIDHEAARPAGVDGARGEQIVERAAKEAGIRSEQAEGDDVALRARLSAKV